jgi:ABC-type multidrug transport system fused ATPase/permease subunit
MDEATANIDMKTEEIIQKAINEILNKSTVITIAHRIKTILHYDRILVLSNGEIAEYDSPKVLLGKEDSLFYQLYNRSSI